MAALNACSILTYLLSPRWVLLRRATAPGLGRGSHTHKNNPGARPRPHGQLMGDNTDPPTSVAPQSTAVLPSCPSAVRWKWQVFFSLSFFTTPSVRPGPPGSYYGRSGPGPWPPPVTYLSPRRPLLCLCSGGAYGNLSKATGEVVLNGVLCTSLVTDLAWSIAGHRAGVWALCGHHRGSGLPEVAASCEAQSQWEPPPSP